MKFNEWAHQNPLQLSADHVTLAELRALIGAETDVLAVAAQVDKGVHTYAMLHILTPTALVVAGISVLYSDTESKVDVDVWPLSQCLGVMKKMTFKAKKNAPYSEKQFEKLMIRFTGGEVWLLNESSANKLTSTLIEEREALAARLATLVR